MRHSAIVDVRIHSAVVSVKRYQSLRFQHSYSDLIAGGPFQSAALFFLHELYGNVDFSVRDAQFSRVATAIERLLPEAAVATAVALAQLHVLTERLDYAMAKAWTSISGSTTIAEHYVSAWRTVGQRELRLRQLQLVVGLGWDLQRLTRKPGLRQLLRMMRLPAAAAGLAELQRFLEAGFDTFACMATPESSAEEFLNLIQTRETKLIVTLFMPGFNAAGAIDQSLLPSGANIGSTS